LNRCWYFIPLNQQFADLLQRFNPILFFLQAAEPIVALGRFSPDGVVAAIPVSIPSIQSHTEVFSGRAQPADSAPEALREFSSSTTTRFRLLGRDSVTRTVPRGS
jgi:hypothetical protein